MKNKTIKVYTIYHQSSKLIKGLTMEGINCNARCKGFGHVFSCSNAQKCSICCGRTENGHTRSACDAMIKWRVEDAKKNPGLSWGMGNPQDELTRLLAVATERRLVCSKENVKRPDVFTPTSSFNAETKQSCTFCSSTGVIPLRPACVDCIEKYLLSVRSNFPGMINGYSYTVEGEQYYINWYFGHFSKINYGVWKKIGNEMEKVPACKVVTPTLKK
jgi:hypothetical protein